MSPPSSETNIPTLTEIIPAAPVYGIDLPERRVAPPPVVSFDTATLSRLEQQIREQVLSGVLAQIDVLIEQHIQATLLETLRPHLQSTIEQALTDAIKRALSSETDATNNINSNHP
jgi:hypothetical protein